MSSPILSFTNLFHFSHSAGWVVASYCVFNFHFTGDKRLSNTFYVLNIYLNILFWEEPIQVFGPFLMELSVFSTIYRTHTNTDS